MPKITDKTMLTDGLGQLIGQYYDATEDEFKPLEGTLKTEVTGSNDVDDSYFVDGNLYIWLRYNNPLAPGETATVDLPGWGKDIVFFTSRLAQDTKVSYVENVGGGVNDTEIELWEETANAHNRRTVDASTKENIFPLLGQGLDGQPTGKCQLKVENTGESDNSSLIKILVCIFK